MTDSPIVFLDSGIGGLPYLRWLKQKKPSWPLIYVADTAHFPYGELGSEYLREVVFSTAGNIFRKFNPALLVLACNSASVTALADLQLMAPCPVVGTVPAIKTAANLSGKGAIGILATEATINSDYLEQLLQNHATGRKAIKIAAGDIVRFVENELSNEGRTNACQILKPALGALADAKVDSVVLGCTHFLHVYNLIREILGESITLVDSREGVGRRVIALYENLQTQEKNASALFYLTHVDGDTECRYRHFARVFGLEWKGDIS